MEEEEDKVITTDCLERSFYHNKILNDDIHGSVKSLHDVDDDDHHDVRGGLELQHGMPLVFQYNVVCASLRQLELDDQLEPLLDMELLFRPYKELLLRLDRVVVL